MSVLIISILVGFAIPMVVILTMALMEPLLKHYHEPHHHHPA